MSKRFVCGFVIFLFGVAAQPKKGPRKGVLTNRGKLAHFREECLFCLIQAVDVDFDDPLLSDDDGFQFECLLRSDGEASGISSEIPYQIDLPQEFVNGHMAELEGGLSTVCVRGGTINFPNDTVPGQVIIPEGADLELIPGGQDTDEEEGFGIGNRTVLVVRVLGTGESPVETLEEMQGAVFGLGNQPLANSMKAQFGRCSFSKIDFIPASGFDQFDDGVLNIQLDYRLQGRAALGVMVDATDAVKRILGVEVLRGSFDHVIFCIARGTTYGGRSEWTAFATLNGWRSVFNSGRCDSLSYLMHEIGHNLGLVHSADDFVGNSYGDTTGMMGSSEATVDGPVKCFNPSKNWLLGWYNDKAVTIGLGETWSGRLVSFVDYELADPSKKEVVLLRMNDFLYAQYNRAKDFNAGTSLHRDKVVVVIGRGGLSSSSSVLRAGLGRRERSTWKGITIQVCALRFDAFSGMDYAEVSVHPIGSTSACAFVPSLSPSFGTGPASQLPSSSPTATPATQAPTTLAPSPLPTPAPTPNPSSAPTPFPTRAPTPSPTPAPTAFPTSAPTPNPTPAPSPSLSPNPTPFPSPFPVTPAPNAPVHVAQWVQVGDDIDGENPGDFAGSSVALSSTGEVLAIGADGNDGGGSDAGHVRVYTNTGGGWEQRGSDLDGSAAADWFGYSVALSADGTILAVGAIRADGVNGADSGRVHVHQWFSSTWQPIGSTLDGVGAGDNFGYSLALSDSGTILAVGGIRNGAGGFIAGHVRVFEWTGGDWNQQGNDLVGASTGDLFGYSVSLSLDGSVVACGGNQGGNAGPGYVQIYRWTGSVWQQQGSTLVGFSFNDGFGRSVSLSGDGGIVAVGAELGNYAAMYRNVGTNWVPIGQPIRGEALRDYFGFSLSLSFDGKTVVVGGPLNNSNGPNAGHALVFRLSSNGQEWMQAGQDLVGEAKDDRFGYSTSVSYDGTRVAIGARTNDGNRGNAGHVRVYDLQ